MAKVGIESHWLIGARRALSPNQDARPIPASEINLLVIHSISLPPGSFGGAYIEQFFCNQLDCESQYQGRSSCNDFSLGIELEGTDKTPYTDIQYVKLAEVTQSLFRSYPRLLPERIVGHGDIAPGRKTDPGPSFDWTRYRSILEGLEASYL